MKLCLTLFSFIIIFTSCENSIVAPNDKLLGLQFFPVIPQSIEIYNVQEISYNNDGSIDTSRYLIQDEWIGSVLGDDENKLEGYRYRINQDGQKEILSTVVKSRSSKLAKFKIGNSEELKLSFPISEGKTWDGKPQEFEVDDYSIYKAFQSYQLGDSLFESTVQVIQEDNQDSIANFDQRIEIYAESVGLIYKISSQLEFCRETECLGLQQIDLGKTVSMTRLF